MAPTRPSIMSLGDTTSAPASACDTACTRQTAKRQWKEGNTVTGYSVPGDKGAEERVARCDGSYSVGMATAWDTTLRMATAKGRLVITFRWRAIHKEGDAFLPRHSPSAALTVMTGTFCRSAHLHTLPLPHPPPVYPAKRRPMLSTINPGAGRHAPHSTAARRLLGAHALNCLPASPACKHRYPTASPVVDCPPPPAAKPQPQTSQSGLR